MSAIIAESIASRWLPTMTGTPSAILLARSLRLHRNGHTLRVAQTAANAIRRGLAFRMPNLHPALRRCYRRHGRCRRTYFQVLSKCISAKCTSALPAGMSGVERAIEVSMCACIPGAPVTNLAHVVLAFWTYLRGSDNPCRFVLGPHTLVLLYRTMDHCSFASPLSHSTLFCGAYVR